MQRCSVSLCSITYNRRSTDECNVTARNGIYSCEFCLRVCVHCVVSSRYYRPNPKAHMRARKRASEMATAIMSETIACLCVSETLHTRICMGI